MSSADALVIGGGPAGLAAACELAGAGCTVIIVHQDATLGGPVHRHETPGSASAQVTPTRRWQALLAERDGLGGRIRPLLGHAFIGLDGEGKFLVRDLAANAIRVLTAPRAVFALGAVEQAPPIAGWQKPGVMTAGGLQLLIKSGIRPPADRIVLAGSGPLLLALGAQMARAGQPPIAILEAGRPFRVHPAGLALVAGPEYVAEAMRHRAALLTAGVPYRMGTRPTAIDGGTGGLKVTARGPDGTVLTYDADLVAVHDGLIANDHGLPRPGLHMSGVDIRYAGDCRQVLGGRAAIADGRLAALLLVRDLPTAPADLDARIARHHRTLARHQRLQKAIARLFATDWPTPADWPDDLVLCRCENRTMGDLRALYGAHTPAPKEVKLVGRFCMGECQGRLCERRVLEAIEGLEGIAYPAKTLTGERWPLRPTPITAFLNNAEPTETVPAEVETRS